MAPQGSRTFIASIETRTSYQLGMRGKFESPLRAMVVPAIVQLIFYNSIIGISNRINDLNYD